MISSLAAMALSLPAQAALTLHLNFDDTTNDGTIMANVDGSGTIAWGDTTGVTSVASGKFGSAISLTTASDVWSNQSGTNLNTFLNSFTVAMHIREIPGGENNMANWQDFASFGDNNASSFKFEKTAANGVGLYTDGTPGGGTVTLVSNDVPVNDGAWHHLAMVSDGTTMQLFIDGVSRGTAAYTPTAGVALDAIQLAGAYGAGRKQNVQIDDLGIWNEALTAEQISYYAANAIPEPSATALLGLGGLALVARRRRK